jgi:hypothetical protein
LPPTSLLWKRSESKIKLLLDAKANANYSYRGCTIFEATVLSRSPCVYSTICLLQQYGCLIPLTHQLLVHNHRRGLIATTIADGDPRLSRLILHAPLSPPWYNPNAHKHLRWNKLLPPALLSDNMVIKDETPSIVTSSNSRSSNKSERASTSAVILGGMGRTVGVDGGYNWAKLTNHAIATASLEGTTAHLLPWLIWAYGVDIKRVTRFGLNRVWYI